MEAVDGDTDINKRIEYRVAFFEGQDCKFVFFISNIVLDHLFLLISDSEYIEIDQMTGNIIINPINRDLLQQEVFPFQVISSSCIPWFYNEL